MPTRTKRGRLFTSRALAAGGTRALRVSERLLAQQGPTLAGDRWVEWSFCMARMAEGPGRTLDFGADIGFLALAAAQRGHDVVALDRLPSTANYEHERITPLQGDILDNPPTGEPFDQIINCSSVEHVGLGGRYGSPDRPDGDLEAMANLKTMLAPGGRMILTIPVGEDMICEPHHRIYGPRRLEQLTSGYEIVEGQFWRKDASGTWRSADRATALSVKGSDRFYALGLFVLA